MTSHLLDKIENRNRFCKNSPTSRQICNLRLELAVTIDDGHRFLTCLFNAFNYVGERFAEFS